jgi:hypothetical protein
MISSLHQADFTQTSVGFRTTRTLRLETSEITISEQEYVNPTFQGFLPQQRFNRVL